MIDRACRFAFKDGFAKGGQRVIVVAGVPLGCASRSSARKRPRKSDAADSVLS
jgi:hypothetical protein